MQRLFLFFNNKSSRWRESEIVSPIQTLCQRVQSKILLNKLCIIKSAWLTITFFFTWEIKWMTHRMKDQEVKVSCLHFWNVLVTFFEPSSLERNIFLNLTQPMFQINTILEFFVSFSSYTKSDCDPTTKNRFWKFNPTFVLMYFLKKIKP